MPKQKELRFVRLKSNFEDLVGYVTYKDECLIIEMPLRIEIETIFDEGRQILSMQEYLPQSVVEIKEIEIPMSEIMFATPVRAEFYEQFEYVSDFFYNNQANFKEPKKKRTKASVTNIDENVVSIIEALAKKDKGPMH